MSIQIKLVHKNARVPTRGSDRAAGLDLYATENVDVRFGMPAQIPTGICIAFPENLYGRIAPRSGLSARHGIEVGAGVIDQDYRGEVIVILHNNKRGHPYSIAVGDRIAQLIITPYVALEPVLVDELEETERSGDGFGSTGR